MGDEAVRMTEANVATKKAEEQPMLKMAETSAPYRMKMSQPNVFLPKLMFFLTSSSTKDHDMKNWADCFDMKAGAVYLTIIGQNANEKTLNDARYLLKAIAYFIITGEKGHTEDPNTEIEKKPEDLTPENKLAIDAVYLVVGFLHDINKNARNPISFDRENLDKYCQSKHGAHVLSDIAMLDNQLRLDCITKVVETLQKALQSTKDHFPSPSKDSSRKEKLLQGTNISSLEKFKLSFNKNISEVASVFCWYYTPFYIDFKKIPSNKLASLLSDEKGSLLSDIDKTLLECLHHCIVPSGTNNSSSTGVGPVLTAKELRRNGVRLEASTDQLFAVEFKEPTLKLPVLFWDSKMETVVLNLVALESSRTTRPVTRYLQLLNELVEDEGDVKVLKRCGILKGKWKRDEEVVNFVKRVDGFASYPSMYTNVDDEMDKVKKYIDERNNRFLVKYSWVPYAAAAATVIVTAMVATKRRGS
ncbi:hypothetical protein CKAN_00892300 [Cinnamomum micranthum f. kanehirae]|uniref:Uncharacterized protein n=1 Tax=Cinnamomum micranthum f. kanehirae TaxID=337451 RepID=A0A443NP63_9MAGN|nr:hypothetical protein CKAN_00892300 [Cinnamomum micranthum f. kanehirae]